MTKVDPLSAERLTNLFRTSPKDNYRIVNREGSMIEFKESFSFGGMAQYFKTIASFANNSGGYIIFGVANKPRRLKGLKDKNLKQFEDLKVEDFTKNLLEYFSPEIKWEHCTFEFKQMSFGVIYTYPLLKKPCICKKNYDHQNIKYSLKEGEIYYRYGGRSERIRYEELNSIIDDARKNEEAQWINFIKKAAKIGVKNACLLDLETGIVSGKGGTLVIDETLLSKISFIKEGEFVETNGAPALRLIGDITNINTGKIIVKEPARKVVKAIELSDIVKAFLNNSVVEEPMEYLRVLCSAPSAYYPFHFLIASSTKSYEDAIQIIEETIVRGKTKGYLLERLKGKLVSKIPTHDTGTKAYEKRNAFRVEWINENVDVAENELIYCLKGLMSLDRKDVKKHEKYIRKKLLAIYDTFFETAESLLAHTIRQAICRVDELLYYQKTEK